MRPTLSVQLYSVRDELDRDPAGAISSLARLGFSAVEPYDLARWAEPLAPLLADAGISAPTAHAGLFGVDLGIILAAAARLGTTTVIAPSSPEDRWMTREDVAAIARELNDAARRAADAGIAVGYHNHWWELERRIDGASALEVLADHLDEGVVLEVDAYWAAVGGEDPAGLLERLGSRVAAIHVKDGPITKDTSAQLPAGSGAMPTEAILAAAPSARLVIEFDAYTGDIFEGLAAAKAAVDRLEGAA